MTIAAVCPACGNPQMQGLLDDSCTTKLETALREVPGLLTELDVAMSKQARIGSGGGAGLANERDGMGFGAMQAHDDLANCLVFWAADVTGVSQAAYANAPSPSASAASALRNSINEIRRHPAVEELLPGVIGGISDARRAIDRPANRTIIYVGPCPEQQQDGEDCAGHVFAYIPTQDDRPSSMRCGDDVDHKWTSVQWLRAGKRIVDLIERRKPQADAHNQAS